VDRLLVGYAERVKIWSADGEIIYSDRTELIGDRFELGEDEQAILRDGGTEAEVADLSRPENRFEQEFGGLLEVYTRIESPEGEPLLLEVYYRSSDVDARQREVFLPFLGITIGGLLALLALATPIIWVLTRRLTRASRDRERLLESAIDASDAERRRIARDLHDGVVQDLAGTAFAVSAVARDRSTPAESQHTLEEAGSSLRTGLRSLRSLLVEIHPPDLHVDGLASALEDLTAPATSAGLDVTVSVTGIDGASDAAVALVWRVAQEAVRNAMRHASAASLSVSVALVGDLLRLDVVDDGIGFDPAAVRDPGRFGLRGLASLVDEAGGRLDVRSRPGAGTTVHLEVRAR
jgi:signal transduction histidine kinase